jgi:hypothetical protein
LKRKYINDVEELLEMVDVIRAYLGKDSIDTLCRSRKMQNNKNWRGRIGYRKALVQKQVSAV